MTELFELWTTWWSGPLPDTATLLWGRPIWWWERVGTVVQVIAILGLVFELIGEKRLHALAQQVHSASNFVKRMTTPETSQEAQLDTMPEFVFYVLLLGTGVTAGGLLATSFVSIPANAVARYLAQFLPKLIVEVIYFVIGVGLALIVMIVTAVVVMLALSPVLSFMFRGFAKLLQSPRLRTILNVSIVLASVFNLHFTLLAQ